MSWETFHRRSAVLRRVSAEANRRCDGDLPTELPGVNERFADRDDLLAALQLRWYNHLSGAIELETSRYPSDLEDAVVAAWCRAANDLPGVRMVLDTNFVAGRTHTAARHKEWELLAASASQAWGTEQRRLTEGRRIEDRARRRLASSLARHQDGERTRTQRGLFGQLHQLASHDSGRTCGGGVPPGFAQ